MFACVLRGHRPTDRCEPPACSRCGRKIRGEGAVLESGLAFVIVVAIVTTAAVAILLRGGRRR